MDEYYISYFKKNIHILDHGYYTYINAKFRHNEKSYVIVRSAHKNKTNPDIQLILKKKIKIVLYVQHYY